MREVFTRYITDHQVKQRVPCPLHGSDKQKSMQLYDTSFYCFSCSTGGDLIKFVSCLFRIPYAEAINKLASDFHIQKPSFTEWREQYKPTNIHNEIDNRFIIAERDLSYLSHVLDEYKNQPLPKEIITKWSKEIITYVR